MHSNNVESLITQQAEEIQETAGTSTLTDYPKVTFPSCKQTPLVAIKQVKQGWETSMCLVPNVDDGPK